MSNEAAPARRYCDECRFFTSGSLKMHGACMHPKAKKLALGGLDLVSRDFDKPEDHQFYARECRADAARCGEAGNWFETKTSNVGAA